MKIIKTSFIGTSETVSDYCKELTELTNGKFSFQSNPHPFFINDNDKESFIILGEVTDQAYEDMCFADDWISINGERIDISIQDVIDIAEKLKIPLSAHQVNYVIKYYTDEALANPTDLWSEIVENLLYQYETYQENN